MSPLHQREKKIKQNRTTKLQANWKCSFVNEYEEQWEWILKTMLGEFDLFQRNKNHKKI